MRAAASAPNAPAQRIATPIESDASSAPAPRPSSIFDAQARAEPAPRPAPVKAPLEAPTEQIRHGSLPTVRSAALPEEELHAELAPLWRRAIAVVLDGVILLAVSVGYLVAAAAAAKVSPAPTHAVGLDLIAHQLHAFSRVLVPAAGLGALLAFVYTGLFGFLWRGHTPGRKVAGIRLVDLRGRAPHPVRAVIRAGLSLVSFAVVLAGFWLALVDRRGQTLHDKLARTFVVRDD